MTSVLFGSLARANATTFGKAPSAQFASIQPSVDTCTFGAIRAKHLKDKEAVVAALELVDSLEGRDNPTQEKLEKKQSLADSIVNFLVRDNGNTLPVTITPFPNSPEYKTLTIDGTPYEINMTYGSQNVDRNRRYHVPGITIENSSH